MREHEIAALVVAGMYEIDCDDVEHVQTFADAGLHTLEQGVVLRMSDGGVYQLPIVCVQRPRGWDGAS